MKKYLNLYLQILTFNLKSEMSYRLNYFLKIFYGPAYLGVMLLLVNIAYTKAPNLGGLNKDEAILLYSIFAFIYALAILFFIRGWRYFLWQGLRTGVLDLLLTKPANIQFLVGFSWPSFEQLPLVIGELILFIRQAVIVKSQITIWSLVIFGLMLILGLIIIYLVMSTYATLGFYVTRAAQIIEILDKTTDFANYPTTIFPLPIQMIMFTIVPIAFCSYVPTLFLLNRGNAVLLISELALILGFYYLNRWAWQRGLKQYASASS